MQTNKLTLFLLLAITSLLILLTSGHAKRAAPSCTQCWTCSNCKKVMYKTVEVRPSMKGCSKSWWGHNWAYQGCLGDNVYKCRRCGIKISVDEVGPINIKSDNCTTSADDDGQRHQFVKIK